MEEVWKDISLTNLPDAPGREEASKSSSCFRDMILQDFLASPFKETPSNAVMDHPPDIAIGLFDSSPPTVLSLNSSSGFQYLDGVATHHQSQGNAMANAQSSKFPSHWGQKRVPQPENGIRDRQRRRMAKNRESAARSRARKQAYTNELELEIDHLMRENAKLRKMRQQVCEAASSAQIPPKHSLYRTATAPF